jgi:hypothetical protein
MAITYPLSLPSVAGIAQIRITGRNAVAVSSSPFTYKQQVMQHQGARWEAEISLPPTKRDEAEEWIAFLFALQGQYGTFLLGDPLGATPRGSASSAPGTPLVNGASQTGVTLAIDGLPNNATNYLRAGDYIQLGSGAGTRLHKVLENASSNGSGQATLSIWPQLRESPSDNASVTVSDAKGVFRLATPESSFSINEASFYGMTFTAFEAI